MNLSGKRVLVTGASGFIGGHVCEALLGRGARVRAMVRRTSDVSQLAGLDIEYVHAELNDVDGMNRACEGVDVVVHTAAAVGSFGEWEHFHETGVLGTERLIEAAHRHGARRFVHLSSIAVYGFRQHCGPVNEDVPFDLTPQGWNHYVREKVMSEQLLWQAHAANKIEATSIRPVIVIGARDRNAIPRLVDLLHLPVTALPGSPDLRFPLVCIEDCVDVIMRALENDVSVGRAYNVAGEPIRLGEFFRLLAKHARRPAPKLYLPTGLVTAAVGVLEGVWKILRRPGEPITTRIAIVLAGYDYDTDCTRAKEELGWTPNGDYEAAIVAAMEKPAVAARGSLAGKPPGATASTVREGHT
ncbi:NAD-dependent epimerase/dehydratase family protein [Nannocystis radixulma]|uniref:NAD-dependent epimerase/dehydratase family protein n=1 Tax=Nannocystis radixulma TaxID=2995305 RepID=A0ABT5BJB6_9BACT|nr:NAD-dependent epimerase/dehydratase family protein [Nannocystis radixulma]MDC0673056.1 NAD-dependent epimerase/dehydratase family protein [Nannocystis radixulma]